MPYLQSVYNLDTTVEFAYSNPVMEPSQQLNKPGIFTRASRRQRVRAGIVLLVLTALFGLIGLMATGRIDSDRWLDPCGFKQRFALPCPTCGMTTSALAFARGRVFEAFYVQPAAALACCVMVVAAFLALLTAVFGIYFRFLDSLFSQIGLKHLIVAVIILVAAAWAVTLSRAIIHKSL
jgi:hypothetical protein